MGLPGGTSGKNLPVLYTTVFSHLAVRFNTF